MNKKQCSMEIQRQIKLFNEKTMKIHELNQTKQKMSDFHLGNHLKYKSVSGSSTKTRISMKKKENTQFPMQNR